jgi:hypothetical protein
MGRIHPFLGSLFGVGARHAGPGCQGSPNPPSQTWLCSCWTPRALTVLRSIFRAPGSVLRSRCAMMLGPFWWLSLRTGQSGAVGFEPTASGSPPKSALFP